MIRNNLIVTTISVVHVFIQYTIIRISHAYSQQHAYSSHAYSTHIVVFFTKLNILKIISKLETKLKK